MILLLKCVNNKKQKSFLTNKSIHLLDGINGNL